MNNNRLIYTLSPADKHKFYGTSALPAEFIKHLRTLFELLDKGNNGFIHISDLEDYWGSEYQLDNSLSNSVIIKTLYDISPGSAGLLSFPRLCTGIKEALLQVKVRKKRPKSFISALSLEEEFMKNSDDEDVSLKYGGARGSNKENCELAAYNGRADSIMSTLQSDNSKEIENLVSYGVKMNEKIGWWYNKMSSQFCYDRREVQDFPIGEQEKIVQSNELLEDVINLQSLKGYQATKQFQNKNQVIKDQQERIAQLEGEKSLLIRELFQLKAQLKTPASKGNFSLFN